MALPTYESVSPAAARRPARSRVVRVVAGTAVVLAITALVALVGQSTEQARPALLSKDRVLNTLALDFLKHGAQMSVQDIQTQLAAFTKSPNVAELKFPAGDSRAMMLAAVPRKAMQKLEGEEGGVSLLCQKKDIIIQKFDELLRKLGGEELSANITMGKVTKEWKEAMEVDTPVLATTVRALRERGQLQGKRQRVARAAALSSSPHAVLCCRASDACVQRGC